MFRNFTRTGDAPAPKVVSINGAAAAATPLIGTTLGVGASPVRVKLRNMSETPSEDGAARRRTAEAR